MSLIEKTDAIAIRIVPFSRTSHVVTWLSRDHGQLVTVIKGANRPKSDFLGQYDLFQTCELLYYGRDRDGLHIAKECTPLVIRAALHRDWRAAALASYACDVLWRISPEGGLDARLYAHLQDTLDSIAERSATAEVLFWFELALLTRLGLAPQLGACSLCGGMPPAAPRRFAFAPRRGGLVCQACRPRAGGDVLHLTPAGLALLRRWQSAQTPRAAHSTRCTDQQFLELQRLLSVFLSEHLDILPRSRGIVLDILRG